MAIIDDLSEDLLIQIISSLPTTRDAIRTSSISHKWQHLWRSVTTLKFDSTLFPPSNSLTETRNSFAHYVNRMLLSRASEPLHKFSLRFFFTEDRHYDDVDFWLFYAINYRALELDLDFNGYIDHCEMDEDCSYSFHVDSLRQGEVRVLKLRSCSFTMPDDISQLRIVSLRSMNLFEVSLDDETISDLISICVNLESLAMVDCYGMDNVEICSSSLKELSLWNFEVPEKWNILEICAPNLCKLSVICVHARNLWLKCSSSLVEANVEYWDRQRQFKYWSRVVRLLSGVRRLTLKNWWFQFLQTKDLVPEGFVFKNLIHLELKTNYTETDLMGLAAFFKRCPNLQTLIVDHDATGQDETFSQELKWKAIWYCLSSLKKLSVKNFKVTAFQLYLLMLLKNQGPVLEEVLVELKM